MEFCPSILRSEMIVRKLADFILMMIVLLFLFLLFLGFGGLLSAHGTHPGVQSQIYIISVISLVCGLAGLTGYLRNRRKNARKYENANLDVENQKADATADRKRLNRFLMIVAVLSPLVVGLGFLCSVIAVFMAEGLINWWTFCFAALSGFLFLGAGLIGLASAVALLIMNRKQQKSPLARLVLLLLILVNFCLSAPVLISYLRRLLTM